MRTVILAAGALALAACPMFHASGAGTNPAATGDWPTHGGTYAEQRFSPLTQVNAGTVARLGLSWWAEFDTDRGAEATPLVVDGVLYTTTAWSRVYAFDAVSGKQLWRFDPKVPGGAALHACCDVVNRGVAVSGGRVFVGTLDGRLVAIDAKSGHQLWSTQTTDPAKPYTITGAPRVVKGRVLIGNGGAEYGVRGYVSAYDAATGKLDWRFYFTPNPQGKPDGAASDGVLARLARPTWFGDAWRDSGGGGTAWDAIVYDPRTDLLFIGTGNGSPWNQYIRSQGKGDNLFVSSIVALRPETGAYVWHYQITPGDSWDYTATQPIMVADLTLAGRRRHVVMQAPKNGFFYVLDAADGKLISGDKYAPWIDWASAIDSKTGRPVERPGVRWGDGGVSLQNPGPLGAHNWKPMAYSPRSGLVYIPTHDVSFAYNGAPNPQDFRQVDGVWNLGMGRQGLGGIGHNGADLAPDAPAAARPPVPKGRGVLVAWDPVRRSIRWSKDRAEPWGQGGLLAAADLVFQPVGHDLKAYRAADGTELWSYDMGAPAIAAPIAYAVKGVEYVALMLGNGGGASTGDPHRRERLMVFRLDGTAKADEQAVRGASSPVDLAAAQASAADPVAGGSNFHRYCGVCHGASNLYPDLRGSRALLSQSAFKAVVYDGMLQSRGMASFAPFMSDHDVEAIRAYLLRTYAAKP
jgi:quinohemoprotein ethanol dehydrogenase